MRDYSDSYRQEPQATLYVTGFERGTSARIVASVFEG